MKNFCAFTYARENGSQLTRLGTFVGGKILTCALKVLLYLDIFFFILLFDQLNAYCGCLIWLSLYIQKISLNILPLQRK